MFAKYDFYLSHSPSFCLLRVSIVTLYYIDKEKDRDNLLVRGGTFYFKPGLLTVEEFSLGVLTSHMAMNHYWSDNVVCEDAS